MGLVLLSIEFIKIYPSLLRRDNPINIVRLVSPETKLTGQKNLNNLCDFLAKLVSLYIDEKPHQMHLTDNVGTPSCVWGPLTKSHMSMHACTCACMVVSVLGLYIVLRPYYA